MMNVIADNGYEKKGCTVVVEAGAAENVMPAGWLKGVATMPSKTGVKFVGANGKAIGNYGRKVIEFNPVDYEHDQVFRRPART